MFWVRRHYKGGGTAINVDHKQNTIKESIVISNRWAFYWKECFRTACMAPGGKCVQKKRFPWNNFNRAGPSVSEAPDVGMSCGSEMNENIDARTRHSSGSAVTQSPACIGENPKLGTSQSWHLDLLKKLTARPFHCHLTCEQFRRVEMFSWPAVLNPQAVFKVMWK